MNESEPQIILPTIPGDLVDVWLRHSTEAEATLKARLAHIIVLSEDTIISINESQQITLFNPAAERMFGYQADEVLGQPMDLLLPERFAEIHRSHVEGFAAA